MVFRYTSGGVIAKGKERLRETGVAKRKVHGVRGEVDPGNAIFSEGSMAAAAETVSAGIGFGCMLELLEMALGEGSASVGFASPTMDGWPS